MKKVEKWIAVIIVAVVIVAAISFVGYNYYLKPKAKGQEITIDSSQSSISSIQASKIVSLDPAATATLYAIGAYKYVVGSSVYSCYPANHLPNITSYPCMNLEEIINLTPNTVISFSDYKQSQIDELLNAGINYVFLCSGSNSTFKDIEKQNTLLGEITGEESNATKLNMWMQQSLGDFANASLKNKTMLYAMCVCAGGKTETAGQGTFDNQIFAYAHLENIANDSGYYQIPRETIINSNPQVILLGQCFNVSDLKQQPFVSTGAYKNGSIYTVFNTNLFSEPNFRNIFAIQWLIDSVYGVKVSIPPFPIKLSQNPDPQSN